MNVEIVSNGRNSAVLFTGDCVEVMRGMEADSVDSVVCDPPYELGFMGKNWDKAGVSFDPETWRAVLRVLKPGGHLLAFGGTRTYHRIVVAIEDAGFEIRDMVTWLYGQGLPKSMNVGKAIDSHLSSGKSNSRSIRVVGESRPDAISVPTLPDNGILGNPSSRTEGKTGGTPLTSEAAQWEGWGTALKPAVEPIVLARKPFKGTVAANVLEYGTGALNIDGTRIQTTEKITNHSRSAEAAVSKGKYGDSAAQETHQTPGQKLGRWPANVILGHHDDCEELGTKKVKAIKGGRKANITESGVYGQGKGLGATSTKGLTADDVRGDPGYGDEDGMETVADWDCHPDCPVRILDEQTGEKGFGRSAYGNVESAKRNVGKSVKGSGVTYLSDKDSGLSYADKGGASRFFYQAKASKREREAGLEALDEKLFAQSNGGQTDTQKRRNNHPTVKPIALMRYLVRLVTPPGGRVLDPFVGSGTTVIAANLEGFDAVGIDQDETYIAIAAGRVRHWQEKGDDK